jgi:hypothetical protein
VGFFSGWKIGPAQRWYKTSYPSLEICSSILLVDIAQCYTVKQVHFSHKLTLEPTDAGRSSHRSHNQPRRASPVNGSKVRSTDSGLATNVYYIDSGIYISLNTESEKASGSE